MKNENFIASNKRNTVRLSVYSTMLALLGMSAIILSAAFLLINNTEPTQDSLVIAGLPNLQGESAIIHLKQTGTFDSLAEAVTAARYRVDAADTGASANNEANDLQMNFTDSGWQLKSTAKDKSWSSSWRLSSFGYGTNQRAAASGSWQTAENRVELRRASQQIIEWFVNEPNGVEHGFTLGARPGLDNNGEALRLVMAIDGDLTAQADENGQALTLLESDGAKALRYEKLKVWDADGKDLTARMQTERGGEVWLEVEEAAAVYPITIDPTFTQQAKITASDGAGNDWFGRSISISGDTAIVGASLDDIGTNENQGSAYIFVRNGTSWTQQQKLTAADGATFDLFGESVSISGDTVIIGAYLDDIGVNDNQGSAYIFIRNGTTWTPQAKLTVSDGAVIDYFGISVGISGDTVIVGANGDDIGANNNQGSAYIFVRSGAAWTQQAKHTASDGLANDYFGRSVGISGDTTIVGAPNDTTGGNIGQGSAYIFVRTETNWTEQAKLTASDGGFADGFGNSVGISGETVIIGAMEDDFDSSLNQGSAYIFVRDGTVWTQQQKLSASDGAAGNQFGDSVSISGDTAIVGAFRDDIGANEDQGSAYIFVRNGSVWTQQQKLNASDGAADDQFSFSVAVSGGTVIIGAHLDDIDTNENQGSAYIFQANATPTPTPTPSPTPQTCTPFTTVTEGDLFPGGFVSFGVSSGPGSVTVDHVNAGTGLQSFTVVGTPTNATVNMPAYTPGTFAPVTVTFTAINPALAVDFTLRAASTFHAANIRVRCVSPPQTPIVESASLE